MSAKTVKIPACDSFQEHNHEVLGSVMLGAPPDSPELLHNHRFAGVTGPAKSVPGGHVHVLCTDTDFFFNHFHSVEVFTGLPILVKDAENNILGHVHGFSGVTSCNFNHDHNFRGVTLLQNPIGPMPGPCNKNE